MPNFHFIFIFLYFSEFGKDKRVSQIKEYRSLNKVKITPAVYSKFNMNITCHLKKNKGQLYNCEMFILHSIIVAAV